MVEAFNRTEAETLAEASAPGALGLMPVCGDAAKGISLATRIRVEAIERGPLAAACDLEPGDRGDALDSDGDPAGHGP